MNDYTQYADKPNMFIILAPNGTVLAAYVDDKSESMAQDVVQWVREHRQIIYGKYESVTIGEKLE